MKQKRKVELLAPAGNKEAFYGAIHAGADAVYLGGSRFGARAYADNFTEEELISCIRYAHLFGRRVYLTVNTLVKEAEFAQIYDYLAPFYEAGLDGVIVQDIGVFVYIRECFADMELHVSTQMTITGKYGASLLQKMGACRVVPARELSLAEIVEMKEATGLEIETFIHGAMCYCYSGQCLFSSILGGRSGNRGRCAQPCRLPYKVQSTNRTTAECYPLSLKDMCTIEHIPELIEAGIDSFKIEGRMKKPEYAAGVTAIYRKYIDKYYEAPQKPFQVTKDDLQKLSGLYIRSERQDGYYYKHNGKEMVTLTQPSYSGNDEALLAQIRSTYLEKAPKQSITIYGTFVTGENAVLTLVTEDISITVTGDMVQPAQKQPITQENIKKQLGKLGDSIFRADEMEITLSDDAFYPLKAINELRRSAVAQLEDLLIEGYGLTVRRKADSKPLAPMEKDSFRIRQKEKSALTISLQTYEQLTVVSKKIIGSSEGEDFLSKKPDIGHAPTKIFRIYINGDIFVDEPPKLWELLDKLAVTSELIISMPHILRRKDEKYLQKLLRIALSRADIISGFQVRCLEAMGFLKEKDYKGRIYADASFYMWNRRTLGQWKDSITGYCLPYELKGTEQRTIITNEPACEKVFYGRIPMMITANCVERTTSGCRKGTLNTGRNNGNNQVELIDRYQKKFPVVLNCEHCMNIIYNSVPLSLHGEWSKWQNVVDMRLDFTTEGKEETKLTLDYFTELFENRYVEASPRAIFGDYTTGHEKRGVE